MSADFSQVKALAAQLAAAGPKAVAEVETKVLTPSGQALHAKAQASAPVDTGALRASIYLRAGLGEREVGTDLRYAGYVEFGTSVMGPQPFLLNHVLGVEQTMVAALKDAGDPFT